MTLSDIERRYAMGQIFSRISLITLVPFYLQRSNSTGLHTWGVAVFLGCYPYPRPYRKGAVFQRTLLFMRTPFDAELPNFDVATRVGRGLLLVISHAPTPRGPGPSARNFGGLCVHPLSIKPNLTWYHVGEDRISFVQPRLPSQ